MRGARESLACACLGALWQLVGCGQDGPSSSSDENLSDAGEAASYQGCGDDIPAFQYGMLAAGEMQHLTARLEEASPNPPERYLNAWTVQLLAADGSDIDDAEVQRARTFMPIHGHDGNVEPVITTLDAHGRVLIERLNFTMRGPWEVQLWLSSASRGDDYAVFHVCIPQ